MQMCDTVPLITVSLRFLSWLASDTSALFFSIYRMSEAHPCTASGPQQGQTPPTHTHACSAHAVFSGPLLSPCRVPDSHAVHAQLTGHTGTFLSSTDRIMSSILAISKILRQRNVGYTYRRHRSVNILCLLLNYSMFPF